jgi:hypothetical protein
MIEKFDEVIIQTIQLIFIYYKIEFRIEIIVGKTKRLIGDFSNSLRISSEITLIEGIIMITILISIDQCL